jgi:hypothetical protein
MECQHEELKMTEENGLKVFYCLQCNARIDYIPFPIIGEDLELLEEEWKD